MSMVSVDSGKLQDLINLIKNKQEVAGLSSELKTTVQGFEDSLVKEFEGSLVGVLEAVADAVIESVVPAAVAPVVEAVVNPVIENAAPGIEASVESGINNIEQKVSRFFGA